MDTHRIVIGGVTYGNVGSIEEEPETEYYHNVTALDGTKYQDVRYTKSNYTATFFNLLNGQYTTLRDYIKANKGIAITCGFPNDTDGFVSKQYFVSIVDAGKMKGYHNGNYYRTGMKLYFEAVSADE